MVNDKDFMVQSTLKQAAMLFIGCCLVIQAWIGGIAPAQATGVYDMPVFSAQDPMWVLDQANVISRINQSSITTTLEELAKSTENQVHLVTIRRLDYGETIESFTHDLFEAWFPNPDEQVNQTLLVLDTLTNAVAIQSGETAQALLTAPIATSVAQETVMVPLREGDRYNQAFLEARDRMVAVLSGMPDPGPPQVAEVVQTDGTFATPEETQGSNATIWVIGLLLAATVIPMATYYLYQAYQS